MDRIQLGFFFGMGIVSVIIGIFLSIQTHIFEIILIGSIFGIGFTIIGLMISDGIRSINKFRKGYDFDESFFREDQENDSDPKSTE